jgi:tRNA pseudouridine32 synthase/23S rRNA pseudouridine746 synthase
MQAAGGLSTVRCSLDLARHADLHLLCCDRSILVVDKPGDLLAVPGRGPDNRPYQIYDPVSGREALTRWQRIGHDPRGTRLSYTPLTGRTHQLRVHSAHLLGLDAPIIGDRLYGSGKEDDPMLLRASFLSLTHPDDGRIVEFRSEARF